MFVLDMLYLACCRITDFLSHFHSLFNYYKKLIHVMQNIRGQNNIRCYENYFLKQTVNGLRVDSNLTLLPPECFESFNNMQCS